MPVPTFPPDRAPPPGATSVQFAPFALRRRESLAVRLIEEVRARIGAGRYPPGDRIPTEQQLSDEFGVSRSVVREAISSLRAEGLIETRQGVGAFVLPPQDVQPTFRIDPADLARIGDVLAMLELRTCVEAEAASLAARRRTEAQLAAIERALTELSAAIESGGDAAREDLAFHTRIAEAAGNRYLLDFFVSMGSVMIPRARVELFHGDSERRRAYLRSVHVEHEQVWRAIQRQDPGGARAAMDRHLTNSRDRLAAASRSA